MGSHRAICNPMFTVALFTAAEIWEQPKCQSSDDQIQMRYTNTTECYSAMRKKKEILPFLTTQMDLKTLLSEISQRARQRQTNTAWYHSFVESLKKNK